MQTMSVRKGEPLVNFTSITMLNGAIKEREISQFLKSNLKKRTD